MKEKFHKRDKVMFIVGIGMLLIILTSYLINRPLFNAPQFEMVHTFFWESYFSASILIFAGVYARKISRYFRSGLLFVGVIFFGYLVLHFLFGFHNLYWGN